MRCHAGLPCPRQFNPKGRIRAEPRNRPCLPRSTAIFCAKSRSPSPLTAVLLAILVLPARARPGTGRRTRLPPRHRVRADRPHHPGEPHGPGADRPPARDDAGARPPLPRKRDGCGRACGIGRRLSSRVPLALPVAAALGWLRSCGPARNGAGRCAAAAARRRVRRAGSPAPSAPCRRRGSVLCGARAPGGSFTSSSSACGDRSRSRPRPGRSSASAGRAHADVVLHDGERIEGVPGQAEFRRIRFAEHGIPSWCRRPAQVGCSGAQAGPGCDRLARAGDVAELAAHLDAGHGARAAFSPCRCGAAPARRPLARVALAILATSSTRTCCCRPGLDREGEAARGIPACGGCTRCSSAQDSC